MKKKTYIKLLITFIFFLFLIILNTSNSYAYTSEDFLLSSDYNTEWIESYLDLGQNPVDGIKGMIDTHQDYFNFTSLELGDYWVCEKIYYAGGEEYFYWFFIATNELHSDFYYNTSHGYFYTNNSEDKCFSISFTKDGLYASSNLLNSNSSGCIPNYGYTQTFTKSINASNNGNDSLFILVSNHDIYSSQYSDKLVFQEPVTKNGTTLAPVMQREKTRGTLQGVLTEIIQILPLIIVVMVSLVGLLKALKILFQVLRRS